MAATFDPIQAARQHAVYRLEVAMTIGSATVVNLMKAFVLFPAIFLLTCESSKQGGIADYKPGLEGSWTLVSMEMGDSVYLPHDYPNAIIQKHLTGTHFAWFYYDPKKDRMIAMGGGTYTTDETYTLS